MTDDEIQSVDLEDTFSLHGHSSKPYRLIFSPSALTIQPSSAGNASGDSKTQVIPIDDLYGCLCMKAKHNPRQCHLVLYLYVLRRTKGISGTLSKKQHFHRSEKILTYGQHEDFQSNLTQVTRWHRTITQAIYRRRQLPDIVTTKRDRPVLVFVNPAGGAGKAYRLVMEYVVAVWSEAEFPHHIMMTEYAGHARDYVKTIQLAEWSGIVLASGDGLIHEVINGLMSRDDWRDALQLPVGHVPCGSGNAFITNVIHHSKQPIMDTLEKFVVQAAVLIVRHDVIPFDLTVVDLCNGQRLFSFLCIEWGIIADVDCDSEQYRFMGGARFTVEAVKRILQPRVYSGYIDYIPYDGANETVISDRLITTRPTTELHQHLLPLKESIPVDSSGAGPWRRIEGPFAHVLITSKQCISKDVIASSKSTLSDGYLTLQFIRSDDATRLKLAKTFTKLSDGKHFDYDFVQWMPIRAFRIVPDGTEGNMMVDGEKVPFGPIQGEALPSFGRCMGKHPKVDPIVSDV